MASKVGELSYEEHGNGGPRLLLLHGFPMTRRVWTGVIRALGDAFCTVAIDLPGFGDSPARPGWTMDSLAGDLIALATKNNWQRYTVVGLSMGGYLALAMAEHAARGHAPGMAGLILIDSRIDADAAAAKDNRNRMIEIARTGGGRPIAEEMLGKLLSPATIRHAPHTVRHARAMMESVPAETMIAALTAMRERPDRTALLETLKLPLGIIVGEDDVPTPPVVGRDILARATAAGVQAWLEIIPQAGHLAALEQPVAVANAIRSHLLVLSHGTPGEG